MFITRLKLVNFIGIKNGLGKDEIEISFPKNKNIITMISGKNGSGKSTIMSQLTPFKDSFDDRRNLIIPGKEGIKEIDIEHNGHIYKIKHVYGKTASSFIMEDDIELNENGGVRTFEEIIKAKFKLGKEYFKVGKIGSNTANFIQFNTSERKKYISTFVETVEKYLKAFEVVNKKAKVSNQQIKQISDDLKKLDDIETLKKKIIDNNKNLEETNLIINQTNEDIGRITAEIENLDKTLKTIDYNESKSILDLKKSILEKNQKLNNFMITKYGQFNISECTDKINNLLKELEEEKKKYTELNTKLNSELANNVSYQNDITKINAQIGSSQQTNLEDFKKNIEVLKESQSNLKNQLLTNSQYSQILEKANDKALIFLDGFKNFMLTILSYYDLLNNDNIQPGTRNAELFFKPDFGSIFGNFSKTISTSITNNRELLESKNNEYSNKNANLSKLEILEKRPKECHIDSCPFIADALKYANLPEELNNLENIILGIKKSLETNENKLNDLSDIRIAYSNIAKSFKILNPRENIIYAYFLSKYGKISNFTKLPYNTLLQYKDQAIAETEMILDNLNKLHEINIQLNLDQIQYEKMLDSEKTKLYFQNELNNLNAKINTATDIINTTKIELEKHDKLIQKLDSEINEFKDYKKSLDENNILESEIKLLESQIKTYESTLEQKNIKTQSIINLNTLLKNKLSDRENISNAITLMKATEMTINQYTENLKLIKDSFNSISLVKDSLDPKSGIPLVFIKSYLDGTESIANELLNIAYNGKFEIRFIPTASDFFIQVRSGSNVIEDIKLASQGEISLTTISISLALIERSIGEYNIVYLDEIDGPLDKNNRESFIHIIEKQIEKLGLKQIFVISHNNAFEDCAMNLILLNGHPIDKTNAEYMKNKNIIYDVDGE